jgi:hypothetical protein
MEGRRRLKQPPLLLLFGISVEPDSLVADGYAVIQRVRRGSVLTFAPDARSPVRYRVRVPELPGRFGCVGINREERLVLERVGERE